MVSSYQIVGVEKDLNLISALQELQTTLFQHHKSIPSKYHYDKIGSQLFEQITKLPEYYLTRCEKDIFLNYSDELTELTKLHNLTQIIELGAGDGHKTKELLREMLLKKLSFEYIPIDYSESAVKKLVSSLRDEFGDTELIVNGIIGEYLESLQRIDKSNSGNKLILFLGSSIGNFNKTEAQKFLTDIAQFMRSSDKLLIGFDLKKDLTIIEKAYNDKAGVTKEFNLHLLDILNETLGGNFHRENFFFHSFYNPLKGCVESWLISKKPQQIVFAELQKNLYFDAWEGIHVENSYKYNVDDMQQLLNQAGLILESIYFDKSGYFAEALVQRK